MRELPREKKYGKQSAHVLCRPTPDKKKQHRLPRLFVCTCVGAKDRVQSAWLRLIEAALVHTGQSENLLATIAFYVRRVLC